MVTDSVLCHRIAKPETLAILALLVLIFLWLQRAWLWLLLTVYLGFIILLGIVVLALFARRVLVDFCRKGQVDPKGIGSKGHAPSVPVYVPPSIYKRPDPLIYSQAWMIARGLAITWDNPDIHMFEVNGTPAQPHALLPKHPYLIRAQIWNGSVDAPVVNLLVRFSYLIFGIGAHREIIGEMLLPTLPVKGAIGLPRVAEMSWTTPAVAGHYCVQVELVWADDADPGNNLGQTNLDVKALNSPNASFTFPLRNNGFHATRLRLTTDAYRLPTLDPCGETRSTFRPHERITRHFPEAHAIPPGWQVAIAGAPDGLLAAGEERPITVKVTAPDGFAGALDINVNAFDDKRLVGGVTLRVHS